MLLILFQQKVITLNKVCNSHSIPPLKTVKTNTQQAWQESEPILQLITNFILKIVNGWRHLLSEKQILWYVYTEFILVSTTCVSIRMYVNLNTNIDVTMHI